MVEELKNKIKKLREEMNEDSDLYEFEENEESLVAEEIIDPPTVKRETTGQIIAFMSGKGGAGKTGIAVNVANYCAINNKKVLLVDCDMNTNGATSFFKIGRRTRGLFYTETNIITLHRIFSAYLVNAEIAELQRPSNLDPIKIKENYYFIPANIGDGKFEEQNVTKELVAKFEEDYLRKWRKQYDVIILDFGAGEGQLNVKLSELLDKICIVMNPDEVSRQVVRTKLRFLFQKCILDNIICCVNILTQQKIAVSAGTLFNDFSGFMYSKDYARLYKRGNMIERSDHELWERLSSIVRNIYEDRSGAQADNIERMDEEFYEKAETESKSRILQLLTTIIIGSISLCLGILIFEYIKVWDNISSWILALIVVVFTIIEVYQLQKIRILLATI